MKLKFLKTAFLVFLTSCNSNTAVTKPARYQTSYSATINEEKYDLIHDLLQKAFADFPKNSNKKITYSKSTKLYLLQVQLKKNHFKMKYRSDTAYDDQINYMHAKIKSIIK